jgi:cellulose synthase/poly-beta-1,6-N-acetylglucosamine synthase-like glycosyltransferase
MSYGIPLPDTELYVPEFVIPNDDIPILHGMAMNENQLSGPQTLCKEFRGQTHYRPKRGIKYWADDIQINPQNIGSDILIPVQKKKQLTILVPFYNEEASELLLTLNSIHQDFTSIEHLGYDIHVLLVMDGWWKASESMKKLIENMFPKNQGSDIHWPTCIKPNTLGEDLSKGVSTFILQRTTFNGLSIEPITISDGRKMKISCIVKRDNRRKINSHIWMLTSFADAYKSEFVFLTDCGTLFEHDCLVRLVKELIKRPNCTAVSGRQRVMSAKQQDSDELFYSMRGIYRAAQCYDYESSLAVFVGAFSLFGMLPVIPGPCGLYRYDAIKEEAVPFYINTVDAHPGDCGILMSNLNLAEDRVLSYASVVKTHENAYTCYIPDAIFYFAAETEPLQLFQQRRRWINGTIAGYLWLLSDLGIIWNSGMRSMNKPFLMLLLLCQVFMYMAVAISPAIFASSFYWCVQWGLEYLKLDHSNFQYTDKILLGFYAILYLAFVIRHHNLNIKPAVSNFLVHLVTIVNAIIMVAILYSMFLGFKKLNVIGDYTTWFEQTSLSSIASLLVITAIFGPLVLALMHSLTSFGYMLLTIVQFYLFLPTMVIFIGIFSFSRVADLTWGNRPTEKTSLETSQSAEKLKSHQELIKIKGSLIAIMIVATNFIFAYFLIMANNRQYYIKILAFFIFSWSIIQMAFSILYFIGRYLRKLLRLLTKNCNVYVCCLDN